MPGLIVPYSDWLLASSRGGLGLLLGRTSAERASHLNFLRGLRFLSDFIIISECVSSVIVNHHHGSCAEMPRLYQREGKPIRHRSFSRAGCKFLKVVFFVGLFTLAFS